MSIGENIRQLRKEQNMSQSQLATMLFLSQDTVSLWERDKSLPDIPNLVKLSKIFNVSTDYILGLEK